MHEKIDRDVLITRVIDGGATGADWTALRRLAADEPEIWRELEETQQVHTALCAAVGEAVDAAAAVEIEAPGHAVFRERVGWARSWGGWLTAAAMVLAWSLYVPTQGPGFGSTSAIGPDMGGFVRVDEPVDALRAYVDRGREAGTVVGLVPDVRILEAVPCADGTGFEVLLVRQIIERQQVDQVYRWAQDEAGNLIPMPVERSAAPSRPF